MNHNIPFSFRIEVFDSDKIGKDKSLGKVELNFEDLDASEPRWFPLKGVKSGEILLNTELLAPGQAPSIVGEGVDEPLQGKYVFLDYLHTSSLQSIQQT